MSTHAFSPTFQPFDLFAPQRSALAETEGADGREPSFALVQSGPPVPDHEVESHLDAVEITVRWGAQVLSVAHVAAGESFFVGEGTELTLPEDALGASRAAIVEAKDGASFVVLPPTARGTIQKRGASLEPIESLLARGVREVTIEPGMRVDLEVGAVTFEIAPVRAGKPTPVGFLASLRDGAFGFVGMSFVGHAAIVAALAMFMPKMNADDSEAIDRDQIMSMQKYLNASAQREAEQPKPEPGPADSAAGGGSTGAPHMGESGAAGTTKPVTTNGHMGFKGAERESSLSKKDELAMAREFGMLGILASSAQHDPNAPTSPWGKEYKGSDDKSAMGKMFGATIDDASGYGLGLWGTGEGGGGAADVIGLDNVSTIGGGGGGPGKWGIGKGDKDGIGNGHGPGKGGHVAKAPTMRTPSFETNGRLPAEVIQRIVRQNFGRFRLCYESGLRQNPGLTGRVTTKFVIGRDGAVAQAADAGSDLPDQNVTQCIVRSFTNLSFPQPEGGVATVTYPIILAPGE
jgi:hypothetical protein